MGHLFIIGGGEERRGDMCVLKRYVELCGGPHGSIAILASASTIPDEMWETYAAAFSDLGVGSCFPITVETRTHADDLELSQKIYEAGGIFMTGGDQKRLVEIVRGTRVHAAMWRAFKQRGTCIGGTSAGASAIAHHMLAYGTKEKLPDKRTASIEKGLGFLSNVTIDQHFSERQRLARLLSAIAQKPDLIGVGIDEDTALIISARKHIEVIGTGAVMLLDGRYMQSTIAKAKSQEHLELLNVHLHLLPAGTYYYLAATTLKYCPTKEKLIDTLRLVTRMPA